MTFSKPILAIESSCDETAVAILCPPGQLLTSLVASQMEIHARFGGVVPEVASRNHLLAIKPLFDQALSEARIKPIELGAIVATAGPGLAPALLVGVSFAKGVALGLNIPYLAVNHLEGHLLSPFFGNEKIPHHLALLVSGGHTQMIEVRSAGNYRLLGATADDAAGEAFDKIAKLLGLPYPGGVEIDRLGQQGNPHRYQFPKAFLEKGNLNFSFSGLKTSVRYFLEKENFKEEELKQALPDICASVQEAIVGILIEKVARAAEQQQLEIIGVSGGVACNSALRAQLQILCQKKGWQLSFPPALIFHGDSSRGAAQRDTDKTDEDFRAEPYLTYCSSANRSPTQSVSGSRKPQQNQREISGVASLATDNAAMIAFAAMHHLQQGKQNSVTEEIMPQWNVEK